MRIFFVKSQKIWKVYLLIDLYRLTMIILAIILLGDENDFEYTV